MRTGNRPVQAPLHVAAILDGRISRPCPVELAHAFPSGMDKIDFLLCASLPSIDQLTMSQVAPTASDFGTFGELLRFLRQRSRLTQRSLGIAVGYSEAYIARLEANQRNPNLDAVRLRFVDALQLDETSDWAERLVQLSADRRTSAAPTAEVNTATSASSTASVVPAHPPTNIRAQLTSFVGRNYEAGHVRRLLQMTRLLTLTGMGGTGKSRLAAHVATDLLHLYQSGVWIAALASVNDGAQVADAVARALGLEVPVSADATAPTAPIDGMEPGPNAAAGHNASVGSMYSAGMAHPVNPTIALLKTYLHDKDALLVLDGCEHVIAACAELAVTLLQSCPQISILATSREPLNVPGEVTWQVPPLSCDEAQQLFMDRAQAVRPDFALANGDAARLDEICAKLDGLPLAVELAASRLRVLSLEQIADRIDDRFHLLTGGSRVALPKHQTLQAMIDWSYDLLSEPERLLFRRLSVFTHGFSLEEAEAVCADEAVAGDAAYGLTLQHADILDVMTQLVRKSMVELDEQESLSRYRLLGTLRQYAHERLVKAGEDALLQQRLSQYRRDQKKRPMVEDEE